ncbi:hypothetical protein D3C78_1538830 [compost metagenome]
MPTCQCDEHRNQPDNQRCCSYTNQLHAGAHQRVVDEISYQAEPEQRLPVGLAELGAHAFPARCEQRPGNHAIAKKPQHGELQAAQFRGQLRAEEDHPPAHTRTHPVEDTFQQ